MFLTACLVSRGCFQRRRQVRGQDVAAAAKGQSLVETGESEEEEEEEASEGVLTITSLRDFKFCPLALQNTPNRPPLRLEVQCPC